MAEIIEHQLLDVRNMLTFRGMIDKDDIESIKKEMDNMITASGAKRVSSFITATYAIFRNKYEVEIFAAVDRNISSTIRFKIKDRLMIINAIVAKHKGNKDKLDDTIFELENYIAERNYVPTSVAYHVESDDGLETDIYMGISPNIV